jgi:hypothetical protein
LREGIAQTRRRGQFNKNTPNVVQGGGKAFPPRDGNPAITDLTQCFAVTG